MELLRNHPPTTGAAKTETGSGEILRAPTHPYSDVIEDKSTVSPGNDFESSPDVFI